MLMIIMQSLYAIILINIQICQKNLRIGCVITRCKLQRRITQPTYYFSHKVGNKKWGMRNGKWEMGNSQNLAF